MLSGRYDRLTPIGEGVSAKVYKAVDTRTDSVVAIKVLNPHLHTDEISLERFKREIQITRFLGHPQVVSIYDLVTEGEQIYMVMEYLEGLNLKDYIRLRHPVDLDAALDILKQALGILSVCHAKNVIHRDLKPQNMIVDARGTLKLLDFGISRMTTLSDLTQTGTSLGSPEYMAPELFATNTYDPRSDIYALGIIFFELLTGELPFKGDSLPVLYRQHLTAPVPALRNGVPVWVQHLIAKMLAKQGHERYQSVDETLADIEQRKVMARGIPSLERRECLACGAMTIAELPLCTSCGHDASLALAPGRFDLWSSEKVDPAALATYGRAVFKTELPRLDGKPRLLVARLDHRAAELLRQGALRHGLVLTVKKHTAFGLLRALGALVAFLYCAQSAAIYIALSTQPFDGRYMPPHQEFLMTVGQGVLFLLLSWFFLGLLRRQVVRPAFRDLDAVRVHVESQYGWLAEIAPALAVAESVAMRESLAHMIEKYLLLLKSGARRDTRLEDTLRAVLRSAAEVARLAAEIERNLDASPLVQQAALYTSLGEQLAAAEDDDTRDDLARRRAACAARLEEAYALQDAYGTLSNRLVHLHAVFNTLLGKAIVLRLPLEAEETALLAGCLTTLRDDLGVAKQVQAELRRVA